MGSKHQKKRYMLVTYNIKPDKKFDEFVEFSKKKIGPGKMASAQVVLDMINKEVLKCRLPGLPEHLVDENMPYENVYKHYLKWYSDVMEKFENN